MHILVLALVEYDGLTIGAGLYDVSEAEAASLFSRGPVRPATVDEIETLSVQDFERPEAACASPDCERAVARMSAKTSRRAAKQNPE